MTAEEYRAQARKAREKAANVYADARQFWLSIADDYEMLARLTEAEERNVGVRHSGRRPAGS